MAEWVVLELSQKAEGEDPDFIRTSIRHQIRDAEVYIPVSVTKVGDDRVVNYLVDGYAFIKRAHPDDKYFRLEGSRYVQTVISTVGRNGGRAVRKLACASDADIERFRLQIHVEENQGIGVGDTIVVTSGPYRQIQATVIEDIPEKEEVSVHIKLRSKEDIVTLPRSFLRLVQRAVKSPYLERAQALRAWFDGIKPFLTSDGRRFTKLLGVYDTYHRLDVWQVRKRPLDAYFVTVCSRLSSSLLAQKQGAFEVFDRASQLRSFVLAMHAPPHDPARLREQGSTLTRLVGWDARWKTIVPTVQRLHSVSTRAYSALSFATIEAKFLNWSWFEDVFDRLGVIKHELDEIEQSMSEPLRLEDNEVVDTVIVDGHNLAFRCATAPGLDSLKDSHGRYTGAIVGVLRSLGSYRKKYPSAEIIVTWDGSSKRRKELFPDYKANRPMNGSSMATNGGSNGASPFDPVHWLRDLLPFLGVKQAWNPGEEADDVIAALVRGHLGEKRVVIISTDRDLLQLVSPRVRVFLPNVERMMDAAAVEEEYGVAPDHIVDLRAIDGDTSDNIPGVRGFGLKTAAKLLRLYGTVDGVYSSNFSGVTTTQYKKLRESEKQVRLNLQLMHLHHDVPFTFVGPNPDQIVAAERLKDVEVKSDAIIAAMLSG